MKALVLALLVSVAGNGGKVDWSKDVEDSIAKAKKNGQPVLMYFTADW